MRDSDPSELADLLEREAEELKRRADALRRETEQAREDSRRKRGDEGAPGAIPPQEDGSGEDPG